MRRLLRFIIPRSILTRIRIQRIIKRYSRFKAYDERLFFKHSNILNQDTQSKCLGKITLLYHVIEKGLTMPNMKLGFARERMHILVSECENYQEKEYDTNNVQFLHAVGVIAEYKRIHFQNGFILEKSLKDRIDVLLEVVKTENNIPISDQIDTTSDSYFAFSRSLFDKFSISRHSVRHFAGNVELSSIIKAIELAQNTPSACNRQPSRIHVFEDKKTIEKILDLQNGNRGFGHLADTLLVLTTNLSVYQSAEERNLAYIDGGMYAMNLLYALHFNEVAACVLNWCCSPTTDMLLRAYINIPDCEVVILLIACGSIPEKFKLTCSLRNSCEEITSTH